MSLKCQLKEIKRALLVSAILKLGLHRHTTWFPIFDNLKSYQFCQHNIFRSDFKEYAMPQRTMPLKPVDNNLRQTGEADFTTSYANTFVGESIINQLKFWYKKEYKYVSLSIQIYHQISIQLVIS